MLGGLSFAAAGFVLPGSRMSCSAIHRIVGKAVSMLVLVAQGMGDLEAVELRDAAAGLLPQGAKVGGVDLVPALDLLDHQFGVRDDAQAAAAVIEGPLQAAEETGVFSEVVGTVAEELGELGQDGSGLSLQKRSVAGWSGVATGTSVTVGDDPAGNGGGGGLGVWMGAAMGCPARAQVWTLVRSGGWSEVWSRIGKERSRRASHLCQFTAEYGGAGLEKVLCGCAYVRGRKFVQGGVVTLTPESATL